MYTPMYAMPNDFLIEMAEKGVDVGEYTKTGETEADPAANYCLECIEFIYEIRHLAYENTNNTYYYTEGDRESFVALMKMVEEFLVSSVKLLPDNFNKEDA